MVMHWSSRNSLVCCAVALSVATLTYGVSERTSEGVAGQPPVIPVGLDAYRQWDRWPYQRIGARAYMRSTYDRRGGNEGADASHFLYQVRDDFNVSLDVVGPGVLYFARYNHWHGSPWHYEVDSVDHIIRETGTADPDNAKNTLKETVFIPQELFPNPLTWTWSTTKGADLMWVPLPFERTFRMAYSRTRYGTGYYIYHLYDPSALLSQPIRFWDGKTPPAKDMLDLLNRAGTDIAPKPGTPEGDRLGAKELSGEIDLAPRQTVVLTTLYVTGISPARDEGVPPSDRGRDARDTRGQDALDTITRAPTMMRALELSVPQEQAVAFGRARLRVTWDGREEPSIDAPVALFFGAGTLYNRDGREYLVKGFPVHIRFGESRVHLACYFPMPFFKSAKFELVGDRQAVGDIRWKARHHSLDAPASHVGYFHATYRDHPEPEPGHDLVLLDTRGVEGNHDWSGNFVGTSWIFSHRGVLTTLEGDPRFFFDDSQTPQAYGTGTEEWGGGGDYWGGLNMTLPLAGHPCGARSAKGAKCDEDLIESAYRFLLADLMPFGRRAVIRLEHGGENQSTERYETVTYWYGAPAATLVQTDELKIGDVASERDHRYDSPQAGEPYQITSRYEWGVDTLPAGQGQSDERPLSEPEHYAEFEFEAGAGTYRIWVRGKNLDGDNLSDAVWLQFDEFIGTDGLASGYGHAKGFGNWLDRFSANTYAWSSALPQDPPQTVTFDRAGEHRLRLQPRHPGHIVEQIWLSVIQKDLPDRAASASAGASEIVLAAAEADRLQGDMRVVEDPSSRTGRVLRVGGPATGQPIEVYPPHTDVGRKTTGTTEFTMKLDPQNLGVLLRRKLDYAFPNQRAEVFVADEKGDFRPAGIWYLAGSNTCVYSNPREELGATQHIAQTSNRRFRDDEFIVPRDLTRGRSQIRIRIRFTPVEVPLFPGHALPEQAWSEIRYTAYCWVMPSVRP